MHSREDLLRQLHEQVPYPATARELVRLLGVPAPERAAFRRHLRSLLAEGAIVRLRGNRYGLADRMDLVVGRLETHPSGFGFVTPERPIEGARGDVHIPASAFRDAVHGDRVVVRVERHGDDGRVGGSVVEILERRSRTLVGRFELDAGRVGFVVSFDPRFTADVHIPAAETQGAKPGQMVVVEITRWPTHGRGPIGRVLEVLGLIDEPGVDTEIILRKYDIPDEHSTAAVEEARRLGATLGAQDLAQRTDFRDRPIVTIDGEDAQDFDDAISIERLANGNIWLGVHIADVAHYVRAGGALDTDAYARGTSVYFPERAVHMFPEALATGLCSLRPYVDRLVQSCLMELDARGQVVRFEIHDGVIRSTERMTYTAVNAILTDGDQDTAARYEALVPSFRLMEELFHILNRRRRQRGSIDFDLPEPKVILDEDGLIQDIVARDRNVAHRIIEEFMLVANETVAGYLEQHAMPALYRIHEAPDPIKVANFEGFVDSLGYGLGAPAGGIKPVHFQRLVDRIRGTPEERPIALLMLRTMQKARYDSINVGHFGLASPTYTHFTSPIRRYPDLVVHRLLREYRQTNVSDERREELEDELPDAGRHASDMEQRALEAERELLQWKKVRFMADKVGDVFEGYVTGVAPFGLFVELVDHYVEGLVHVSTMADDYYRYREPEHTLTGEAAGKTYRLGDRVTVQVVRVDLERRQVDLGLEDILNAVRQDESRRGARRPKTTPKRDRRQAPSETRRNRREGLRASRQRPGRPERAGRRRKH
ncbi:MAG: ribonuclease R [Acidobacteriota bacterium]